MMMKVRLFMIAFKNYSRLGACMHTANHPEGDTPRDQSTKVGVTYLGIACEMNLGHVYHNSVATILSLNKMLQIFKQQLQI